jgi:hypothetical protein
VSAVDSKKLDIYIYIIYDAALSIVRLFRFWNYGGGGLGREANPPPKLIFELALEHSKQVKRPNFREGF